MDNSEIETLKKMIAELQRDKEKLQQSEEMFRLLAENSMDASWMLDNQFRFVYVSPAAKAIFGLQSEEVVGRSLFSLLSRESSDAVKEGYAKRQLLQERRQNWESSTYTVEAIHKDGHRLWVEVTVNPIFDANKQLMGYNGTSRDISERRSREETIRRYAFCDPLTNLPNRRLLEDVLERTLEKNRQLCKAFAVLFLDIDGLKKVNDQYGHAFGDILLQAMANRFRHALRKKDFFARLAGDEFMALLPGIGDGISAKFIATRLINSCRDPIVIGTNKVRVGVSIGISFFPADADDVALLVKNADQAMYRAKEAGGSCYLCYGE